VPLIRNLSFAGVKRLSSRGAGIFGAGPRKSALEQTLYSCSGRKEFTRCERAGTDAGPAQLRTWRWAALGLGKVRNFGTRRACWMNRKAQQQEAKTMTYMMTKPCPVCRQQLTKRRPTDTVHCSCGKHVWQG
jgi:hypothetical protein